MGCCQSSRRKQVINHEVKHQCPSIVNTKSLESQREPISGIQSFVSSAGWVADATHGDYVRLRIDETRLFAFLFDAHYTYEAAAFCTVHCQEIFDSYLTESESDPLWAINQTFQTLDKRFLDSDYPPETRAMSGCSGVIVYLDFAQKKGWIGNIGTAQYLLGVSEGAFNARQTDAREISPVHNLQNVNEQEMLRKKFPLDKTLFETKDSSSLLKGITQFSRAIGFGFAKDPQFAKLYNHTGKRKLAPLPDAKNPYILCEPQIKEIELPGNADSLVLYSEGLGQLLSPSEIAIFTSVFNKRCISQLREIITTTTGAELSINDQSVESMKSPSSALTQYAISKAADQVNRLISSKTTSRNKPTIIKVKSNERWNAEQLRSLRIKDSSLGDVSITRGDVIRNLSSVVISLEKQCSRRTNSSLIPSFHSTNPKVQYGWKLLQSYTKFNIQKRRSCLRRWWGLIADVVRDAQRRILQAEKEQWNNEVIKTCTWSRGNSSGSFDDSPAAVGRNMTAFPCTMSSGFRKWLSTPGLGRVDVGEYNNFSSKRSLIL